jgi:hypothetical protein
MPTFRLVTASAKYGSRKIKSKRRNGGTQALREEAAKSGAGGLACTLQSPHTIPHRRGGMKPTKPTNAPAARFAMDGVGSPVCTILPQAKFFVGLAA